MYLTSTYGWIRMYIVGIYACSQFEPIAKKIYYSDIRRYGLCKFCENKYVCWRR